MKWIWFTFIVEILILGAINSFTTVTSSVGIVLVLIHVLITFLVLQGYQSNKKWLFIGGYLGRIIFLFWDLYAKEIFVLPHGGLDNEMFYGQSLVISADLSLLGSSSEHLYSKIMGLLFWFIGDQRIVGQYTNVLLGLSVIFVVNKILNILNVDENVQVLMLLIAAFFPNTMIISAIFLREMILTFFVSLSLLYFTKWFKFGKINDAIFSFLFLGIASLFHSGVIGIALGYFFGYLFYNRKNNKFQFSIGTVGMLIIIILLIGFSVTYLDDMLFGKFKNVEDLDDILMTANSRRGGSAYLTSLSINNPVQLVLFGPIKMFYFIASPLPMNWRGIMDIFSFFTDSILYVYTTYYFIRNRKKMDKNRSIIIVVLWAILGATIIFGVGISNAGTAIRHRQKLLPLFLILLGLMVDSMKNRSKTTISKSI